jgi:ATP-binding cassette, subfamily B, bacterial CvaB/MchF/RaxB
MRPFAFLRPGMRRALPLILQTEATECGLACLAMVAGFHGHHVNLAEIRETFPVSLKGTSLERMTEIAHRMAFQTRALTLDLDQLAKLALPCVLHWNFNHFVVLRHVARDGITIHDPAQGVRRLPLDEVSRAFTGIVLELTPTARLQPRPPTPPIGLRALIGPITGLARPLAQALSLTVVLEAFALAAPFYLQSVIDAVVGPAQLDFLALLALGFGLLLIMQHATSVLRAWALMYVGTTLKVQWRINVMTHLLSLPIRYFERRHLGDIVSRFGTIDTIQQTLTTSFVGTLVDGLVAIVALGVMVAYNRMLGGVALGFMLLYVCLRSLGYAPLRRAMEDQAVAAAKQNSHFFETIRGVKAIKLFGRQREREARWRGLLIDQVNAGLRVQKRQALFEQLNNLLFGIESLLVIWFGARLVVDGHFTVGMLIAFNAYKEQFNSRVGGLIDKLFELKLLRLQGERLADIVTTPAEVTSTPPPTGAPSDDVEGRIEVDRLRFRYADDEPWLFDDVSFQIEPGESVALVGASGCGKTTLVNLLLGVLEPTGGCIRIGGADLRSLDLARLRASIGVVAQDDVLFAGSIADNICFFDSRPDAARVIACARHAAIHDDIAAMPMAYDTLVGDMGTVLSGGQKQRVLLARALYKRPRILLLDEATSHLDIALERRVNAAIGAMQMTRLIVAHRPETIASASRVIALGSVTAEGSQLGSAARRESPPDAAGNRPGPAPAFRPDHAPHRPADTTTSSVQRTAPGPRQRHAGE